VPTSRPSPFAGLVAGQLNTAPAQRATVRPQASANHDAGRGSATRPSDRPASAAHPAGEPEIDWETLAEQADAAETVVARRGLGVASADPEGPEVVTRQSLSSRSAASAAVRAATRRGASVNYSDEQRAVIECDDQRIVANAFAGTGKTTTAVGFAEHRPDKRMLYICLNRANAEEARSRFPSNVEALTTHQLAWRVMKSKVGHRINRRWKPMVVRDELRLPNPRMASVTMRILQAFWGTADRDIDERHAEEVRRERDLSAVDVMNGVAYARLAWKRMLDQNDTLSMPDDAYLKMYALTNPQLSYDSIIFDEAQDANPVTAQIVHAQQRSQLLCIGDRHQAIYQFRGSVNAMEQFAVGATMLSLSQTWRFGPKVAGLANLLLSEFKGETIPIQGMGKDGAWTPSRYATLARTNAHLFRIAAERRGEGVHWVGGPQGYRLDQVMDTYHLWSRNLSEIKDPILRKFPSFDDYKNYADDAADGEARILCKIVEEYTHDVPELVNDIVRNAVPDEKDSSLVLTTAHKSKGLEWDSVQIAEDFEILADIEDKLADNPDAPLPVQDINLLYVAVTRARQSLDLNPDTREWIEKLDQHRDNRATARNRLCAQVRRVA
jgi:superfamily I DNA/RNA helicase